MTQPDFFEGLEDFDEESSKQVMALNKGPDFLEGFEDMDSAPDFFASLDASEKPKEPSFFEKVGKYFKSGKFGEALALQAQLPKAGYPSITPKGAKKALTEFGAITAVEAAFAPIIGAAAASTVAPRILESLARLTQAGATGAAVTTVSNLAEEGELPSKEELIENGLEWVAIDAIMQSLHLGAAGGKKAFDFGKAVNNIAKADNIPRAEVFGKLWDSSKNFIKQKFGRTIKGPNDITSADVEVLIEEAKRLEKSEQPEPIEVKPEIPELKPEGLGAKTDQQIENELSETKSALKEVEKTQGKGASSEKSTLIQEISRLELEKRDRAKKNGLPEGEPMKGAKSAQEIPTQELEKLTPEQSEQYTDLIMDLTTISRGKTVSEMNASELGQYADKLNPISKLDFLDKPVRERFASQANDIEGRIQGKKPKAEKIPELLKSELPKKRVPVIPKTLPKKPIIGRKQAVARSKIIEGFRKAFNDPIRLGKLGRRRVLGIHKLWPKVTRLLKDNDVETAAHEIGHNLHTILYGGEAKDPKAQAMNIHRALKPYLDELKPIARYEPFGMEGFAEFTRMYVTNPDVARELAPNFYNKFEADLDAQYPELKNALLEARDYYDQYLHGTPESRIRAQTSYSDDKGKLANIVDSIKRGFDLDYLKTQFLDDVYPAKRLVAEAFGILVSDVENLKDEKNLYRALRVLKGAVGKGDVFVMHETFEALTLQKINGSLRDILKKLPDEESYREFNDYLIARRAIEKTAQNIETGIELGDAIAVEQSLRGKYGNLAKELDNYNDALLKYAKDSGLLSKKQYGEIKKNNLMYVPFQREIESKGIASGGGKLQAGKPIKRMKGSARNIIAPIESILKNTYAIIVNAEKNLAGKTLAKLAEMKNVGAYVERVPTPIKLKAKVEHEEIQRSVIKHLMDTGQDELLEMSDGKMVLRSDLEDIIPDLILKFGPASYPAGENIITVYFEGKPIYYEVSPDIFEMWTKGLSPYSMGLLTKILRFPARTLRAGAILNPRFIQKNFIRDTWGSWLFTKYGKSLKDPAGVFIDTLYSPFAMMATAAKKGSLYVDWMKAGGSMSTMQSLDRDHVFKKLEEVRKGLKPHQVIKWLRQAAEISEEANRLSEFGKALVVEQKTRLGAEIAAFASRDLSIDFAKMGLQAKALNQIIPFWNATVQGGDKLIRTMLNPKDRAQFLPRVLAFIVLPSLILAWLNKDDENIEEFHEEEKDFNFMTRIGGKYLKIPVPFETGVLAHGLTRRMFNYFIKKDPDAFEKFMGSIVDAMLPNFIPAFMNPFIESWANKSFFTGARIIPLSKENLISKYQYKNNTSSTARLLGRAMAYMLGQETRSRAASPAIIDHFINSWTGGLGRLMVEVSDASLESAGLSDKIPGPHQSITERLGLDAFTTRFPRASTRSIEKFYDNYADATARQKSIKHAAEMGVEKEEEIERQYRELDRIYDYEALKRAYTAMQLCQREINNIWNDPTIEPELKQQMVDDLYLQMIDFAKAANEDIRRHRLGSEE